VDVGELARIAASPTPAATGPVSSAILTIPNLISFARVLLMPVCAWLLASGRFGAGFVLTGVVGASDFLDGWLARRTGTVSRLGQLLDPLADRLLIASVAVALLVRGALPWPAVALLVGRDLVLLIGFQVLQRRGVRPPDVVWLGKAATFALLVALPALALGETATAVAGPFRALGLAFLWVGIALYYVVGWIYVRQALAQLRAAGRGA
jgi:CDP-diacylglycerol--glycerol-3-phosphate 3-phosphatidyltransferase